MGKGAGEKIGIAAQMIFEQIDPAAVHRHRRRIGKLDPPPGEQLETFVLPFRMAAIAFKHHRDRREPVPVLIADLGAHFQKKFEPRTAQRLGRAHDATGNRTCAHRMQEFGGLKLALQAGPIESELDVFGAETAEHRDDPVPPEVRRIRHRRPPIAFYPARVFVQQSRMFQNQFANTVSIIVANGIGHPAGEHQSRPARQTIATRERQLRMRELCFARFDSFRMAFPQFGNCHWVAPPDIAEQILRLLFELIEIWMNW